MFKDNELVNYIETKNTLQIESLIIGESNLNDFENISNYGNYRYRPNEDNLELLNIIESYDQYDFGNFYTDALESKTVSEYAVDDNNASLLFTTPEVDRELYYSLKECFSHFRPRSGINKPLWFNNKYIANITSARRPRYYMSSRYDKFKYWNSYRKEDGVERGISATQDLTRSPGFDGIGYYISDAAPFVVYEKPMPANRIVVKMQTNVAEDEGIEIRTSDGELIIDPLSVRENSSIPKRWKIQYLNENDSWVDALSFTEESLRADGTPIVPWDGHVELYYGIKPPEEYRESFNLVAYLSSSAQLPVPKITGESYVINQNENSPGQLYIWNFDKGDWEIRVPEYGFLLLENEDTKRVGIVRQLVDPPFFSDGNVRTYRDIVVLKGLRVVVETMIAPSTTFDLIELSPRLKFFLSDHALVYDVNKILKQEGLTLPVGNIAASDGVITIMNYDGAFDRENPRSVLNGLLKPNMKIEFYEIFLNIDGFDKFVPIKTMYTEDFPVAVGGIENFDVKLRDLFFRLETMEAPSLVLNNTTLTKAVAVLLDNIGFSNYIFKNITSSNDPIVPYFFVEKDTNVAEVLQRLAVATQTAMFFDEYNNFVVMSKEYLLPEEGEREVDFTLYGNKKDNKLPNIINVESFETPVVNSGQINYTTRYIQRSPASLQQAFKVDEDRTYIYKPVLLWEIGSEVVSKTINEQSKTGGYSLGAVALNEDLTDEVPLVESNQIINNTIDVGENVYWLPRFQGYLYANGEVIRYDAVEYSIPGQGLLWITSNQEYQRYFSNLPFNGKMYPTGNIRIYVEPFYEEIDGIDNVVFKNGPVRAHGRGQFGTKIVYHSAGLNPYWSDNQTVRGIKMASELLFTTTPTKKIARPPRVAIGNEGSAFETDRVANNSTAIKSLRTGILANFLRQTYPNDNAIKELKTTASGTVQASALVFSGPNPLPAGTLNRDFVSYVYKKLDNDYRHFGTRVRIVGKQEVDERTSTAQNSFNYYSVQPQFLNDPPTITGGSGGIGALVNPEKNTGYFFEIVSLTGDNLQQYSTINEDTGEELTELHNVVFYKVAPGTVGGKVVSVPYKLWGNLAQILVDEGKFVGQDRIALQSNITIYDLALEYEDIANARRFYLYINSKLVAIVDDTDPLPAYNNMALFTRGASKCIFENIYALKNLQSKETTARIADNLPDVFSKTVTSSEALRKYAVSGIIQSTYLTGISSNSAPKYDIYYDEFGTIMRECAYFNIKYDRAYPAFLAFLAPTFNNEKTYTSSGFRAGAYGAEFLIFNATDKAIVIDETTGSYLRIIGVTFTQNTSNVLTVDDYFRNLSNFSDPVIVDNLIKSPLRADKIYQNVKLSRSKYGERSFTLNSPYIQTDSLAQDIMEWVIKKTLSPKKVIYLETFGTALIQLGDLVNIDFELPAIIDSRGRKEDSGNLFVDPNTKFVVSEIFYSRAGGGIRNRLKLVEV